MPVGKKSTKEKSTEKTISPKAAVTSAINKPKGFDQLAKFKKSKNISEVAAFKPQEWLTVSEAFSEATSVPGLPIGHVVVIRGHSDTGKSTLLLEGIAASMKMGRLPVLIVTEMKWDFDHAIKVGAQIEKIPNPETGDVSYDGNFIYVDLEQIRTIEDVANFIIEMLTEQEKGKLPYGIDFFWDSAGTIPCQQSVDSKTFNNEWAAAAMSRNFGNYIDQRISMSRKKSSPYTNSLYVVNKIWVDKPATYGAQPVMKNKGGNALYSDASMVITFGNVTNSGTSIIKARKNNKDIEFGKRVKVKIEKNHINGITTSTRIIATPHGFIKDTPGDLDKYKKKNADEWLNHFGTLNFDLVEEEEKQEDDSMIENEA